MHFFQTKNAFSRKLRVIEQNWFSPFDSSSKSSFSQTEKGLAYKNHHNCTFFLPKILNPIYIKPLTLG